MRIGGKVKKNIYLEKELVTVLETKKYKKLRHKRRGRMTVRTMYGHNKEYN